MISTTATMTPSTNLARNRSRMLGLVCAAMGGGEVGYGVDGYGVAPYGVWAVGGWAYGVSPAGGGGGIEEYGFGGAAGGCAGGAP
jgi:hypothetical protein